MQQTEESMRLFPLLFCDASSSLLWSFTASQSVNIIPGSEEYFRKHLKESAFYTTGSKLLLPFGPRTSLTLRESRHVTMKANTALTVVTLNIPESVNVWQIWLFIIINTIINKMANIRLFLFIDVELLTVYEKCHEWSGRELLVVCI